MKTTKYDIIILMALLLIGTVVLSGCTSKQPSKMQQPTGDNVTADEKSVVGTYCKFSCLFNMGVLPETSDCYSKCYNEKKATYEMVEKEGLIYCKSLNYSEDSSSLVERSECNIFFAMSRNDIKACKNLSGSSYMESYCIRFVAMTQKDISLCDKISVDSYKEGCRLSVGIVTENLSICEKLAWQNRYECILSIAALKKDETICRLFDTTEEMDICNAVVAVLKQDVELCETLSDDINVGYSSQKSSCIEGVAIAKKDVTLCYQITDADALDWCIVWVADNKQDESLCEKISNISAKEDCIWYVAKAKKDESLCSIISNPNTKKHCIRVASH